MKKLLTFLLLFASSIIYPSNDSIQVKGQPSKLAGNSNEVKMCPQWSPDGKCLAYTTAGYKGIWITNIKSGRTRQLTKEDASGYEFQWSSDSKAILSKVAKYNGRERLNALKLFDAGGTGKAKLITGYRRSMTGLPHFAARDTKIFLYGDGKFEVFNSGKAATKKKTSQDPVVFFLNVDQISTGNINTKTVTVPEALKNTKSTYFSISPDRSKIALELTGGKINVMNADGTGLVDLGNGIRPKWAPDGKSLVYMISEDDGQKYTSSDIYFINIDGSGKQNLTLTNDKLEMNPCWSPDGKKIAYEDMKDGGIYTLELVR